MQSTSINAYSATAATATAKSASSSSRTAKGSALDMQDFLNLLAAQLTNQDVLNPSTDTEFIAQMAQFTSLQAMQTLTEISYAQHGVSMVGKNVIVASFDEKGNYTEDTGVVTNAKFLNGAVTITVNGKEYDLSSVMEVLSSTQPANETDSPQTI